MAKTSRDARKHIREWSEFFRDGKMIAGTIVDEFVARRKESKYLKQSLNRLIARGFVKERGGKFSPTDSGVRFFRRHAGGRRSPARWDGKWRLITFDVPGNYSRQRDQLRALLKEFDFYLLQKSVWICPSYIADEFWRLVVDCDLDKYCKAMLVDIIEGDAELRKHFKQLTG